jgi:hypothetical protein
MRYATQASNGQIDTWHGGLLAGCPAPWSVFWHLKEAA